MLPSPSVWKRAHQPSPENEPGLPLEQEKEIVELHDVHGLFPSCFRAIV